MSILTKLFVVLMTVFAIAFVSVVVPWVANVETFKEENERLRDDVAWAQGGQAIAEASLKTAIAQQDQELDNLINEKNTLISLNDALKKQLGELQLTHEDQKTDVARLKAENANLVSSNKTYSTLFNELHTELRDKRDETVKLSRQVIQLEEENRDLASSRATFERAMRRTQEQLVAAQEEIQSLQQQLTTSAATGGNNTGNVSGDGPATPTPTVPLHAQITQVQQAGEGNTLVQLNIGSTSGVKPNMRFLVHRSGQYLGTVEIMEVDEQSAAGRVRTLKPGAQIARGDNASAGI